MDLFAVTLSLKEQGGQDPSFCPPEVQVDVANVAIEFARVSEVNTHEVANVAWAKGRTGVN